MTIRKKCLLVLCFITLLFSVSCSMFEAEGEPGTGTSKDTVEVKFYVQKPKSLGASFAEGSDEIYQYKATPQLSNNSRGAKSEWTNFTNKQSAGEFSKGIWDFEFQILYGTAQNHGVIATGKKRVKISEDNNIVQANLQNVFTENQQGSMEYCVRVGAASTSDSNLEIYDDGKLLTSTDYHIQTSGTDIIFSGKVSASAGFHILRFCYFDTSIQENTAISSETISVRFIENATVKVSGTLASGTYVDSKLEVSYPKINATMTCPDQAITSNNEVEFSCNAGTGTFSYEWYVNGVNGGTVKPYDENNTSQIFKYKFPSGGVYNISCVVRCMDGSTEIHGFVSEDVQVN